jgi:hypothetical protein
MLSKRVDTSSLIFALQAVVDGRDADEIIDHVLVNMAGRKMPFGYFLTIPARAAASKIACDMPAQPTPVYVGRLLIFSGRP